MGPKGSQAWTEGLEVRRRAVPTSPPLLWAPPGLTLHPRGCEAAGRCPALGADPGVLARKGPIGCAPQGRFWANQLQRGMGSGCTKGPLGLTTLRSREGPAGCGAHGPGNSWGRRSHSSAKVAQGRVAAVAGNHAGTTLSPPLPPPCPSSPCLAHPLLLQLGARPAVLLRGRDP